MASCLTASMGGATHEANAETKISKDALVQNPQAAEKSPDLYVVMRVNGETLRFKLDDNPTSRDFITLLPLEVSLEDYAATEKIAYLRRKLITRNAPGGFTPKEGDVTYYAPWGNLAIFHKGFIYSKGLVKLGTVESGLDTLRKSGGLTVRMELGNAH